MTMFEFGRDLRRIFSQARENEDLSWVELIGVDLLRAEARRESIDAGRVSCTRPFQTERRAAALWREHARRTGHPESLDRAEKAGFSLAREAASEDQAALAAVDQALAQLLHFDLCGGPGRLDQALTMLNAVVRPKRQKVAAELASAHARIQARQARLSGASDSLLDAAALMDAALHGRSVDDVDLRLDRAALTLEAGIARRDVRLLDQAGCDLSALVATSAPDQRPLTRARALALCGAGLAALGALAGRDEARVQGRLMFDAAADSFTPDHSPLDWATIQLLRAEDDDLPLAALVQAEATTQGRDLILGALIRERRLARERALAEAVGDLSALDLLHQRLRDRMTTASPLDWAADQVGVAGVLLARQRFGGAAPGGLGMILAEAAATAREFGVPALADRAETARLAFVASSLIR